jgi:PhzF family phenazine biosynthesis protein
MRIPYYQVNAFTSEPFGGNPAGVCLLDAWLPDHLLQQIAAENNFSETAFLVRESAGYHLRWMTPVAEVDLCGHATLAAAYVLFFEQGFSGDRILFETLSGRLSATRAGDLVELDFPSRPPMPCAAPERLIDALGCHAVEVLRARDYLVRLESQAAVAKVEPDMTTLAGLDCLGVIITAPGETVDFVSRFFAPKVGVPEDPVTGSAHCSLIPYWAGRLGRNQLRAGQISKRGGELHCCLRADRVGIGGTAVIYCRGELSPG